MTEIIEPSLGFPLKGTLRRSPFPKLVRQIAKTRSTGSLFLLNGNTKKVVFFEGGQPVSVRSNVLSECLGQILAREGLITQAQCDQTLESIRRTGKKQGELLVEMGLLSEGNLRYGLEAQLRHKLYDIFAWDDGKYQYKPETRGDDYGLRFDTPAEGLILVALLETSREARAREALEPHLDRFPIVEPEPLELEIMPEERLLLATIDGSRSIGELLESSFDPPVPSIALLLYAAIQAGIAKLATSRRAVRPNTMKLDDGREKADAELRPPYPARLSITTYEDTPLPGQLPKQPEQHLPDTDDFGDVEPDLVATTSAVQQRESREVSSALVAAVRDTPDETFDDLDLGELPTPVAAEEPAVPLAADPAESGFYERIAFDDEEPPLMPSSDEPSASTAAAPEPVVEARAAAAEDETEELEELDEVDEIEELDEVDEAAPADPAGTDRAKLDAIAGIDEDLMLDGDAELPPEDEDADLALDAELPPEDDDADLALDAELPPEDDDADPELPIEGGEEMVGLDELDDIELAPAAASTPVVEGAGASEFADGEMAIAEGRWEAAIGHMERAYEQGIDLAELHAMLAWARFKASGEAPDMAEHALELLGYAEEMNQGLSIVFAYRAAVLATLGDRGGAQEAAQRALDLDPYDELAIDVMDSLG
jgi:tetratricopeptide (TPR) repeat protein